MFVQSVQFPTLQAISIFLQIRLDESNFHIFPPCFIKMKWKIEGSSAHKHERTLQFFTFFLAIYSTYNGSARKKNRHGFSHVCVCGLCQTNFPPSNICLYTIAERRRTGVAARIAYVAYLAYGIHKLGSNRHRRRNMAMMQSALITCLLYII